MEIQNKKGVCMFNMFRCLNESNKAKRAELEYAAVVELIVEFFLFVAAIALSGAV